jgi:cell division protein FtsZ
LLELSIEGARGILFTITGSSDLSMHEVNEAAKIITASADPDAKIIFGAVIDENIQDEVKISVIATGFSDNINRTTKKSDQLSEDLGDFTPSSRRSKTDIVQLQKQPLKKPANKIKPEEAGDELDIPAFIRKKMS